LLEFIVATGAKSCSGKRTPPISPHTSVLVVKEMAAALERIALRQWETRRGAGKEALSFHRFRRFTGILVEFDGDGVVGRAAGIFETGGFLFLSRLVAMSNKQPPDQQRYS
jgi:hypothetical protein